MKRWFIAFLVVLASCIPILLGRVASEGLLLDTDTAVLLRAIRLRHNPLSWFTGDWPLGNHFYRPISTLVFELDNRLYGNNAAGYGLTNVLLCVACVLMLFWLLRELTDQPAASAAGAVLFSYWHNAFWLPLYDVAHFLAYLTLTLGIIRHRGNVRAYLPAVLVLLFLSQELEGIKLIYPRMIGWLPGRTASTMTVFALAAMAAYVRSIRIGKRENFDPEITPLSPPATRSSRIGEVTEVPKLAVLLWSIVSLVFLCLALGSYEQAIMLPACFAVLAVAMGKRGFRPNGYWLIPAWLLLGGYLFLRHQILPTGVSSYQKQQLRFGPGGVLLALSDYLFPPFGAFFTLGMAIDAGWLILLDVAVYAALFRIATGIVAFYQARREWVLALTGWLLSALAFLPMAWVKLFEHYHYWPMALRTIWVLALGRVAYGLAVTAWCPPTVQAPRRLAPAPGSLARP